MEDSTEKCQKVDGETDVGGHCCLCLPILSNCNSLVEAFIFIMTFLRFKKQHTHSSSAPYQPLSSSPEVSCTTVSDPPRTAASGLKSGFNRLVPPPPRSTGGGGQTD